MRLCEATNSFFTILPRLGSALDHRRRRSRGFGVGSTPSCPSCTRRRRWPAATAVAAVAAAAITAWSGIRERSASVQQRAFAAVAPRCPAIERTIQQATHARTHTHIHTHARTRNRENEQGRAQHHKGSVRRRCEGLGWIYTCCGRQTASSKGARRKFFRSPVRFEHEGQQPNAPLLQALHCSWVICAHAGRPCRRSRRATALAFAARFPQQPTFQNREHAACAGSGLR